jgi:hypothetical protein
MSLGEPEGVFLIEAGQVGAPQLVRGQGCGPGVPQPHRLRGLAAIGQVVHGDAEHGTAQDGRRGGARVFDAATGAEICRLDHDDSVTAVAFSPDGTRVATGSGAMLGRRGGGSARVFDAATGTEICRLDHDDSVTAVAFSPDGTRVATGSSDRSARVWCADHGQLIEQAVGRLTRNLTRQEWGRYFRDVPYRKTRADLP